MLLKSLVKFNVFFTTSPGHGESLHHVTPAVSGLLTFASDHTDTLHSSGLAGLSGRPRSLQSPPRQVSTLIHASRGILSLGFHLLVRTFLPSELLPSLNRGLAHLTAGPTAALHLSHLQPLTHAFILSLLGRVAILTAPLPIHKLLNLSGPHPQNGDNSSMCICWVWYL